MIRLQFVDLMLKLTKVVLRDTSSISVIGIEARLQSLKLLLDLVVIRLVDFAVAGLLEFFLLCFELILLLEVILALPIQLPTIVSDSCQFFSLVLDLLSQSLGGLICKLEFVREIALFLSDTLEVTLCMSSLVDSRDKIVPHSIFLLGDSFQAGNRGISFCSRAYKEPLQLLKSLQ
jgi:hypothetical protein